MIFTIVILDVNICYAPSISIINNPILAIDSIRGSSIDYSRVVDVAESLGFKTYMIEDTEISEEDLSGKSILFLCVPLEPYYTESEIGLITNFVHSGGGLYIIPFYYYFYYAYMRSHTNLYLDTYYNALYDTFGFRLTGEIKECSREQDVFFTHPVLDKIYQIIVDCDKGQGESRFSNRIASISKLQSPAITILEDIDGSPLFLVSNYGKGKVFVDLTNAGIASYDGYDNLRIARNALTWLKGAQPEVFRLDINEEKYDVFVLSNTILSNPIFDVNKKALNFSVYCLKNTIGFVNLTIPKSVMSCENIEDWIIVMDSDSPSDVLKSQDAINTYISFSFNYNIQKIQIIAHNIIGGDEPEFPTPDPSPSPSLEEENANLEFQIAELESELANITKENTNLKTNIDLLQSQLDDLNLQYDKLKEEQNVKYETFLPKEITYVLLLTTIIFIATTAFFAGRRG
jgi:hypothetical protein